VSALCESWLLSRGHLHERSYIYNTKRVLSLLFSFHQNSQKILENFINVTKLLLAFYSLPSSTVDINSLISDQLQHNTRIPPASFEFTQTSVSNPAAMCAQSGRKSLQGGSSKHGHQSHRGHGSSKGGKEEEQPQATQWYYVWTCDGCWQSTGMSTHLITHCPECYHQRCESCPTEPKKVRSHR
jgi:hypothetical protein